MQKQVVAIILAAGDGRRMAAEEKKQFLALRGISVLERAVGAFCESSMISSLIVVLSKEDIPRAQASLSRFTKPISFVVGGKTRAESARLGFAAACDADFVAFHDAARCLITQRDLERVICTAIEHGAATAATKITDTVKETDSEASIKRTVPRDNLWAASTPQVFAYADYERAIASFSADVTDDNMLLERIGASVRCVETLDENIKITTQRDIAYAEYVLSLREGRNV